MAPVPGFPRRNQLRRGSDIGILSVVRMADRLPEPMVKLAAGQDHLVGMDGLDRAKRHDEVASILDVDHQLAPAMRRELADGADRLVAVVNEYLESLPNIFLEHLRLATMAPCMSQCRPICRRLFYAGAFRMGAHLGVSLRGGQRCVCIELTTGTWISRSGNSKKLTTQFATASFLADKRLSHSAKTLGLAVPLSLFS